MTGRATRSGRDGRRHPLRAATLLLLSVALVAGEVTVAAAQLGSDRPVRFGWQMFATIQLRPSFEVRYDDGRVEAVDLARWLARSRWEIDLATHLPPHLCGHLPGAAAVVVRWPEESAAADGRPVDERPCP